MWLAIDHMGLFGLLQGCGVEVTKAVNVSAQEQDVVWDDLRSVGLSPYVFGDGKVQVILAC